MYKRIQIAKKKCNNKKYACASNPCHHHCVSTLSYTIDPFDFDQHIAADADLKATRHSNSGRVFYMMDRDDGTYTGFVHGSKSDPNVPIIL